MYLKKDEVEQFQSIDYFVRQKLSSGEEFKNTEVWAKEWLDSYVSNNRKKEKKLYTAFHTIPKSVQTWEERMNKPVKTKQKKFKKRAIDFTFKKKAKNLLEQNRYKTLVEFESLQPEEYKMISDWFEKGEEMPGYLRGIVKYQPSVEEKFEKLFGKKINQTLTTSQNVIFYLFIGFFFMMLMLINL